MLFPWWISKSRKTCMSITPNSKITAPTITSSVPAPRWAPRIVADRLSLIITTISAT